MLDSCCISKRLSRVYKGQTGFKFRGLRFRVFWGLRFRVFGRFVFEILVLRSPVLGASFSKLPSIYGQDMSENDFLTVAAKFGFCSIFTDICSPY